MTQVKPSIPDTQALYRGFSYTAKCGPLVGSDGADSFNSPQFQNMSTVEANASQKQLITSIIIN
jgi:hypothetical protein